MRLTTSIIATAVLFASPATAGDLKELVAAVKPSVVHLSIYDSTGDQKASGTGFFISRSGLIVTSDHVIANASSVTATLLDGSRITVVGSLARDPARDIAIIVAEGSDYPALELDVYDAVEVGAAVVVIGNPLGLAWTVSEGIVSAFRKDGLPDDLRDSRFTQSGELMQITAPFSPGSSGSPVFNEAGRVIGVAASIIRGGSNLNFAVPIDAVHALRDSIAVDAEPEAFTRFPVKNMVISAIFFGALGIGYLGIRVWERRRSRQRPRRRSN